MRPPATRRGLLPGIQERIILWRVSPIYIFFVLTKAPVYTLQTEYDADRGRLYCGQPHIQGNMVVLPPIVDRENLHHAGDPQNPPVFSLAVSIPRGGAIYFETKYMPGI